ncbi:MAG: cbb3-type cytochrome c oxidase subunit I [Verrucomicrobia bacterium]|nr:cbb3-type cytochrome c oxidase subunit I [Verrucomicrobiota bacterium]
MHSQDDMQPEARLARSPKAGVAVLRGGMAIEGHAPVVGLPLRFLITGMLALGLGVGLLVLRPDLLATYHYNQYVIAVTHLFTLGGITTIIMGAMYQLVPVALETPLYSQRLARWQFVLHTVGFTGMVGMFWVWNLPQVGHFASILGLGVGLFVYNLARTLRQSPRRNAVTGGIASGLGWLVLTVLAGLYLAAAKCWTFSPFAPLAQMHAHAHLGVIGFFIMMILGVSFKLVPMFALSEVRSWRRAAWAIGLVNAGLAGLFVTILVGSLWKLAFAGLLIGGLAVYGGEINAILRARKRRQLDWGLRYFVTALAGLLPVAGLGVVLAWPRLPLTALTTQLENVYGFLALIGVVTFAILGMLYKIVPFLVWYHRYSREIGRQKVPALADLYSARLQALGYWLYLAGLLATGVATAFGHAPGVRWGCALLAASLAVFALNMGKIFSHLVRPKPSPLMVPMATPGIAGASHLTLTP